MKRIPLSCQGKNKGKYEAIVDDEDYDKLSRWRWFVHEERNNRYAWRCGKSQDGRRILIKMHRDIMGLHAGDSLNVDHINGDGLDNRRVNLRIVTVQENAFNRHDAKGYCWHKQKRKWRAYITVDGTQRHLGLFDKWQDARAAYVTAKPKYHSIEARARDFIQAYQVITGK